ncbi:cytochrome P450 [Amycolatopsis cihanbeyliensis]|uniref:Cytochrome P450 n=1 Tax=Amycolatopsis cihanbeyliensis TaxID=1128664 RepID=A0A542CTV0_AMYCI|nr:cytochrome P450 [Amycolatopsis cihanbeyliensis]TQI94220.1 cytochrome P450 [Amycolatopsis cihanbeyliensis]
MTRTYPHQRPNPFDPPPELAEVRTEEPLSRLAYPDGHLGWMVTTHALAKAVLADPRFSSDLEVRRSVVRRPKVEDIRAGEPARPGFFIGMDPPEHTRYRKLLTGQFTVRRMNQLVPRIEQIVAEHLDTMAQAGPPAELVQDFALPIPSLVICELLGVPYADRDEFQRNSAIVLSLDATDEEASASARSLLTYLGELVRHKQAEPADDLLSGLIAGGVLTGDELATIAFLLLIAGHETTANMLALGTFALLRRPEQAAALRAGTVPIEGVVEELLRYLTIIHQGLVRTAVEDVELDGRLIRAGESVAVALPAANRDPARFADPDTLDLGRGDAGGHLAFGHGLHQCLGQQLARIEMRVGYAELFRRFPGLRLAVEPEQVPLRTDMGIYGVHRLPVSW